MSAVYVLDGNNNYVESMTKEEILAAIQAAAAGGEFKGFNNTAFVSKIRELNKNAEFGVWVGTQAEYNLITPKAKNVLYLISDDPLCYDLPMKTENALKAIDEIELKLEGYDKTEQELKTGYDKTEQEVKRITTDFAAVNENFAAAQASYAESKKAFEGMQLSYDDMRAQFEKATKIETIFESAEGTTQCETSRAFNEFKEVCIVYTLITPASLFSPYKNQIRLVTAALDEYLNISETMPCNSTVAEDVITAYIRLRISNRESNSRKYTRLESYNGATSITGQTSTFKIHKIYGIGEVV
ncbi:MAG: hypothetical protein IKU08_09215 [Clostridia bacterium]|nr:hypothetical protein [Clostridia bacterium]